MNQKSDNGARTNSNLSAISFSGICLALLLLGLSINYLYALGSLFLAIVGVYLAVHSYSNAISGSLSQYIAILALVLSSAIFVVSLILLYSVFTVISVDPYEQEVPVAFLLQAYRFIT